MSTRKKRLQTDVLEKLSSFTKRVEKFAPIFAKKKGVIVSSDFMVRSLREDRGVIKTLVVWPLWDYKLFYLVDVPPSSELPTHSHDESVFRILISGSLVINGRKISKPGTWYVVPATTVPTLFEQNQLVGAPGQFRHLHGERKQLIQRIFLKQAQAQNL